MSLPSFYDTPIHRGQVWHEFELAKLVYYCAVAAPITCRGVSEFLTPVALTPFGMLHLIK